MGYTLLQVAGRVLPGEWRLLRQQCVLSWWATRARFGLRSSYTLLQVAGRVLPGEWRLLRQQCVLSWWATRARFGLRSSYTLILCDPWCVLLSYVHWLSAPAMLLTEHLPAIAP